MRTVVQLSDLHFGMILAPTLSPLRDMLWQLKPDLVIVTGDLTQRAHEIEYRGAAVYLETLPMPQLVVPGNHDIALYNVYRRFVRPLERYRRMITPDLEPFFADDEIAVAGINTARSFTFKGGRLPAARVRDVARQFAAAGTSQFRIVAGHHPFHIPAGLSGVRVVRGIRSAMRVFAACPVDLFLAGHLHLVHVARASEYVDGYDAPLMMAGTATSTRARGEPNSFFVFRIDGRVAQASVARWNPAGARFVESPVIV